jgi:hypothetical protein
MPYACEVFPTFRFENAKPPEIIPQQSSPAEPSKTLSNVPNTLERSESTELVHTPLRPTRALETLESFDMAAAIGKEFPKPILLSGSRLPTQMSSFTILRSLVSLLCINEVCSAHTRTSSLSLLAMTNLCGSFGYFLYPITNYDNQSLSVVSYFSAPKTTSPTTSKGPSVRSSAK